MLRLGVDLGGTKTAVAVFDASGSELVRRRVPTPGGDYRAALEALVELLRGAEHAAGAPCTVGIGIPGAISRTDGRVKNAYNTALDGQTFRRDPEALLEREVRLANDANRFVIMVAPRASSSFSDKARAGTSVPPPGENGMTSRTGL